MTLRFVSVTYDAADPTSLAAFWTELLGRSVIEDDLGHLLPGPGAEVGLRFVRSDSEAAGGRDLHLHVTSADADDQASHAERAIALGGEHADVGQLPEEGHLVLADPEGNLFCVIEPGNSYLEGCGLLAELACDGTRAVGVFWSAALGWPLVWDENEETAVQSPDGGTKVAWGGPPVEPKVGRMRQRFELETDTVLAEVDRLVGLGATSTGQAEGAIELVDPDGNEFLIRQR